MVSSSSTSSSLCDAIQKFKILSSMLIFIAVQMLVIQTVTFQGEQKTKLSDCLYSTTGSSIREDKQQDIDTDEQNQKPLLTIVTAFSENHLLEGVSMLRSLINTNYTGLLYIYILRGREESSTTNITSDLSNEIYNHTNLNAQIIEYEIWTPFSAYCFKPTVMNDYIMNSALDGSKYLPKVIMWSDTSIRFHSNPELWAQRMVDNNVDFSVGTGVLGVVKGTHDGTFQYLKKDPKTFKGKKEFGSGHFLSKLDGSLGEKEILLPWIHCGTRACEQCMAPRGSVKFPVRSPNLHRQDQSVLSVLTHDFIMKKRGNVAVGPISGNRGRYNKYLDVHVSRHSEAKSVHCLSNSSECLPL